MKYFFRLGRNANLSYAEIIAVLKSEDISFDEVFVNDQVLIIESERIDTNKLMSKLGGTIKIGEIITNYTDTQIKHNDLESTIIDYLNNFQGKKYFGFSLIGQYQNYFKTKKDLERFGLQLKSKLGSARFVTSRDIELSSVIVKNEKLLTKGGDINIIFTENLIFIGVTKNVQDFEDFGQRDYDRPGVDAKSGMLPPKLARMMINLAGVTSSDTVLDPFCGSGTILLELMSLGFSKIIGSDLSAKAIEDSKKNIEWYKKTYHSTIKPEVFQADTRELTRKLSSKFNCIISEPFLGPALHGVENIHQIRKITDELDRLYLDSFNEFVKVLPKGGKVVIVLPIFSVEGKFAYMNIIEKIKDLGFKLHTDYKNIEENKFRSPLIYQRPGQKVLRDTGLGEGIK